MDPYTIECYEDEDCFRERMQQIRLQFTRDKRREFGQKIAILALFLLGCAFLTNCFIIGNDIKPMCY